MSKGAMRIVTKTDLVLTLSKLWEKADKCLFVDSSEDGVESCCLTFFSGIYRASVGMAYKDGQGAARIYDGQMKTKAQTFENLEEYEFKGLYNFMLKIQEDLPSVLEGSSEEETAK